MSITIQANKLKVKNSNGNYVSVDVVTDTTTQQRLDAIQTKADAIESSISTAIELQEIMANTFDTGENYSAGDYVVQVHTVNDSSTNKLYRFTTDHAAGAWTGEDVTEAVICDEISDLATLEPRVDAIENDLYQTYSRTFNVAGVNGTFIKSDGGDQNSTNNAATPYIKITPGATVSLTNIKLNENAKICVYATNDGQNASPVCMYDDTVAASAIEFIVPSGKYYLRTTVPKDGEATITETISIGTLEYIINKLDNLNARITALETNSSN